MTTEVVLGDTRLTVGLARFVLMCPGFKERLPYHVQSPAGVEVFRIFVAILEGAPPAVTTKNMNGLFLLCNEFGFTRLLSEVSDYNSAHSVVDSQGPNGTRDITGEKLQIKEALCPVKEALSGVIKVNMNLARGNESLQQSLCLSKKEALDLREAEMRDIAEIREEMGELGTHLVQK
jgi:hypothetical protein